MRASIDMPSWLVVVIVIGWIVGTFARGFADAIKLELMRRRR